MPDYALCFFQYNSPGLLALLKLTASQLQIKVGPLSEYKM